MVDQLGRGAYLCHNFSIIDRLSSPFGRERALFIVGDAPIVGEPEHVEGELMDEDTLADASSPCCSSRRGLGG